MYSWTEMRYRVNSKQSKAFALKQLESGAPIAETDSKAANFAHKILEPYKATADHYIFSFLILSTNTYVEWKILYTLTIQTQLIWISFIEF